MHEQPGECMSVVFSTKIGHGSFRWPLIDGEGSVSLTCKNRNWKVMKPVAQLEQTGCGIASVAVLACVSYREMQRVANRLGIAADDPRLWSETCYVRRLLKEHGLRSASAEVPFTSWESYLTLRCSRSNGAGSGVAHSGTGWCFGEDSMDLLYSTQIGLFVVICAPTLAASSRNGSFL